MKSLPVFLLTRMNLRIGRGVVLAAIAAALTGVSAAWAAPVPAPIILTGADVRPAVSLNGEWAAIADPYFSGLITFHHEEKKDGWFRNQKAKPGDTRPIEYDFSTASKLKVPGDWNTQRASLMYYEGPMWYERDFTYQPKEHTRIFLHVGAANYKSWFWVNGAKVCEHEGGYTSFNCEVTAAVHAGNNFVVAAVDNTRREDGVPTLQTDWWNYGGLTRAVSLIEVPETFIDQYDVHLSRAEDSVIEGWVHVNGPVSGAEAKVEIPELGAKTTAKVGDGGLAAIRLEVKGLHRWSPETPKLYKVKISAGHNSIDELIGFRTVEVRGTEILLNGKPIFLRGISIHAEAPYRTGRANTDKDAETLLGWAKELGANFVRLAHYPHDETMLRAADRAGLLVRAEGDTKIVDDPLGKALDVLGTNEYIGWYEKNPETADVTQWRVDYQKPVIMSEFGGEAKAGLHGSKTDRWTEEYQADIYRHQLGMFNRIPQLRGISPWILMDFRSPNRPLAGIQDGYNRKGLISEQGKKKLAYFILQKAYKEKTVGKPE